jgi:hypothetical protein
MRLTRTLAALLSVVVAAVALSACSSDATKAAVAISKFNADATFSSMGDAFTTSLSSDTCGCIADRLRKLPPEKVVAFDTQKSTGELETLMAPCSAIAVKPHIGDLCMAAVKQLGGDANLARPRCECVERKTGEMDDATIERTFGNIQQGFASVAESCKSA